VRFEPSWRAFAALSLILLGSSACARRSSAPLPAAPRIGAAETGVASWYGNPYHGRRTASGEIFDMEAMTAAHRTLSFGTWVRVDNLDNGKRTDVRITDRGPFVNRRVIDLSRAAARAIDMLGAGTARVKLTVVRAPDHSPRPPTVSPVTSNTAVRFGVQVGAFGDRSRADHLRRDLEVRFGTARLVRRDGSPSLWRVIVGDEKSSSGAEALATQVRPEFPSAAVVRLDGSAR
jgi:rare lipoprotein A